VKQLKEFKGAGDHENPHRDVMSRFLAWEDEKENQNPEDLVKKAGTIVVEPPLPGS